MPRLLGVARGALAASGRHWWAVALPVAMTGLAFLGLQVVVGAVADAHTRVAAAGADPFAPGVPGEPIPEVVAEAVLQRWLPSRSGDSDLQELVDAELRTSRGRFIAERAQETIHELVAIRELVLSKGLPEFFAAIPYWESNLEDEAVSRSCAAGAWQLMPETAVEMGLQVEDCRIGSAVWTPRPGSVASPASPYRGEGCGISACEVDDRQDISRSTQGALQLLEQIWSAPDVAASPDRAGLVVLAYNTGLGALRGRLSSAAGDAWADVGRCAGGGCSGFSAQAAKYVPGVLAAAALVTCSAAEVPGTRFSEERQTGLCRALRREGLVPRLEGGPSTPNGQG